LALCHGFYSPGIALKRFFVGLILLTVLAFVTVQQADMLRQRPTVLKLGPVPNAGLLKALAGEHRVSMAFRSVVRVMFYFGSFFEDRFNRIQEAPEYFSMYQHLENSVRIDPYNMDAYYFSQAAFTWELGRAKEVNRMLDYGMQYRTWDYWIPFYAGFNSAYFLKDYATAATYMKRAAEISGNSLFTTLTARYFHEAGESELGLVFLETMAENASTSKVKNIYERRIAAFKAVRQLETAVDEFRAIHARFPETLEVLVDNGLLPDVPKDPYGGEFYLSQEGKVRTTSKFAMLDDDSNPDSEVLEDIEPSTPKVK
jgi:hypothetical protein